MNEKQMISKDVVFNFLEEFKKFAFKGNVIDLSVGMIIGSAFSKIVSSLVDNIIMPIISIIMPSNNTYKDWSIVVLNKPIPYGVFFSDIVTFLITSFALFFFVKNILFFIFKREKEIENKKNVISGEHKTLLEIKDIIKKIGEDKKIVKKKSTRKKKK